MGPASEGFLFPLNEFIGVLVFGFFLAPVLVFCRHYLLRGAPKTRCSRYAEVAFDLYGLLITIDGGFIFHYAMDELRLSRMYPDPKDEEKVLDGMGTPFAFKANYYMALIYSVELWLLKGAFCTYFIPMRRTFGPKLQAFLYFVVFTLGWTIIALILGGLLFCRPIERNWTPGNERCMFLESKSGILAQTILNLTTDFMIVILALWSFCVVNRTHCCNEYLTLVIIFIGCLSPAMAILRFKVVYQLAWHPHTSSTALARANASFRALENYTAMIAFFLPSIRVYIRHRVTKPAPTVRIKNWWLGRDSIAVGTPVWTILIDGHGFPKPQPPREPGKDWIKRGFGLFGKRLNRGPAVIEMVDDTVLSGMVDVRNGRPIPMGRDNTINPIAWYDERGRLVRILEELGG